MNQKVKMYTTSWCPDCRRAKYFLKEHGIPFEEINIEDTPGASEFVIEVNQGKRRVPTFDVDGRTFYCSPYDPQQLALELRVKTCSGK
ncbi:MAG: glutaredoxin family protein [Terriglobia bacterium]